MANNRLVHSCALKAVPTLLAWRRRFAGGLARQGFNSAETPLLGGLPTAGPTRIIPPAGGCCSEAW
jgi:hypothetical protein